MSNRIPFKQYILRLGVSVALMHIEKSKLASILETHLICLIFFLACYRGGFLVASEHTERLGGEDICQFSSLEFQINAGNSPVEILGLY